MYLKLFINAVEREIKKTQGRKFEEKKEISTEGKKGKNVGLHQEATLVRTTDL